MVRTMVTLILILGVSFVIAQPMNNQPCKQTGACPTSSQENMMPGGQNPDQMCEDMMCQMPMGNPKEMMHGILVEMHVQTPLHFLRR